MLVLELLFWAIAAHCLLVTGYLGLLTVAAFFFRPTEEEGQEEIRFAAVVPAHNESVSIEACVKGLLATGCPQLQVIVLADNCDDDTADKARAAGATVAERRDPGNRGKGQALDWLLRQRAGLLAGTDAVAIIDADTQVDPAFFRNMAAVFRDPKTQAAQGYYGVSNPTESWRTALLDAALCVFHHLRPAGRVVLGGTAGLRGNGMTFRTRLLLERGWPAHSIVEDIEFSLTLLLDGVLVRHVPQAVVNAEMAGTARQAASQRKRWEGGRFALLKAYGPRLAGAFAGSRAWAHADALLDLLTPPLGLLALQQMAVIAAAALLHARLAAAFSAMPLIVAFYVCAGLYLHGAPAATWRALALAPLYLSWKILVYLGMLCTRKPAGWVRTARRNERER